MSESRPKRERKSLNIECKKTQCNENLHCFLDAPKQEKTRERFSSPIPENRAASTNQPEASPQRCCWNCGANLIDWVRVQTRTLEDVDFIFKSLQYEYIRHEFWCRELDLRAVNQARRRGRAQIPAYAEKRIRQSIGAAQPFNEGHQTPGTGDVLFYAQHATATCCRRCLEVWYGIPQGRELSEEEISFCTELLVRYVNKRLPDLTDEGEKVPPIRQKATEPTLNENGNTK